MRPDIKVCQRAGAETGRKKTNKGGASLVLALKAASTMRSRYLQSPGSYICVWGESGNNR